MFSLSNCRFDYKGNVFFEIRNICNDFLYKKCYSGADLLSFAM